MNRPDLQDIRQLPSPNSGERRAGAQPDMVVLHYTAMENAAIALDRLCDPEFEVSCHYLIGRDGTCWQLVDEENRAWHAGSGSWGGRHDVNSHSIGIELDNDGASPFSEPLMATLEALLSDVMRRWHIPPERVIGHSDMAPGRKIDPGPRFDWQRLAKGGLACGVDNRSGQIAAAVPSLDEFAGYLTDFGYPADADSDSLLAAFRARFRPWASGAVSETDVCVARTLASRFPVDRGAGTT